jgi:hypothetical protein
MRRTFFNQGPPHVEPTFIGDERKPKVTKLFKLKRRDGVVVSAALWFDPAIEAVLEITVNASNGEDVFASEIGEQLRKLLVAEGAAPLMEEAEAS